MKNKRNFILRNQKRLLRHKKNRKLKGDRCRRGFSGREFDEIFGRGAFKNLMDRLGGQYGSPVMNHDRLNQYIYQLELLHTIQMYKQNRSYSKYFRRGPRKKRINKVYGN